ncbi:ABC transporter ATP-binding protein [Phyllobacterium sp. 0TCS1.6C]|uniref:ABC transporter ATP-binding protein n=1 Tax=unclassified Phyllobacterium TaxID=2638441 RepID=UPI00226555BD|nr:MULTISPECIES: ABC transporter ATP-binding protein [unclassified Phyllobacterium]MCX8281461.1 ABC transporter ATP-binding protein [Phyllobacterium sp. 0TCS1.6C]MCX8292943.1 ABC transporter ATP-binding protein [Phyllobacterium sp. 0TCS1.6A]
MAGLKLENVTKTFGDHDAVSNVSMNVANGEFVAVLGPSGCGKTTLLRLVAGFEQLNAGQIIVGGEVMSAPGQSVPPELRRVGIVFQNYALWPHMTVAENVGYSLKVAKVDRATREKRVADALALVDLQSYGDRRPANLSGGQRQRVALARCLVSAPSLVLFDEPLANLDVHLRAAMEDEFAAFHKRTGTTIIYITHDQAEAMALADRIAVMDRGRLIQFATPRELYEEPATEMVASFIAQGMVVPCEVLSSETNGRCRVRVLGQEAEFRCRKGQGATADAKVCIRSADIRAGGDGPIGVIVRRSVYKGGGSRIEAVAKADESVDLHFELADPHRLEEGATARISIGSGWVIPAEGAA